jgi:prepilin-type N-terminal cleavage/methylation domain-containing protein
MYLMKNNMKNNQKGFTIIEFLIAMVVFSVVLIIITTAVLAFTRQYYKGVISSSTQNTARSIIDDVVRSIQFSPGAVTVLQKTSAADIITPASPAKGYCLGGSKRYSFSADWQVEDSPAANFLQAKHGMISDDYAGCNASTLALDAKNISDLATVPGPLVNPRELLGQHMRLVKFDIKPLTSDTYTVSVGVAYGDDDLLCSPTLPAASAGGCLSNAQVTAATWSNVDDLHCKSSIGDQFCAVSQLTTTVQKRVN